MTNLLPPLLAIALTAVVQPAQTKITHAHLVTMCINDRAVTGNDRRWTFTNRTSFVFTMRNEPRSGITGGDAGLAMIAFTPEAGHAYEIEVRADATAFARRTWERGKWKPVVRDRTTDAIVSDAPTWIERGCSN